MFQFDLNALAVLAAVATVQSLVFDYFPYVAAWYEKLEPHQKRQLAVGLGALFAILAFVGSCQGYFQTDMACAPESLIVLVGNIAVSVATGYSFHEQTKPSKTLKKKLNIV